MHDSKVNEPPLFDAPSLVLLRRSRFSMTMTNPLAALALETCPGSPTLSDRPSVFSPDSEPFSEDEYQSNDDEYPNSPRTVSDEEELGEIPNGKSTTRYGKHLPLHKRTLSDSQTFKSLPKKRKKAGLLGYTTPRQAPSKHHRHGTNWVTQDMVPDLFRNPRPLSEDVQASLYAVFTARRQHQLLKRPHDVSVQLERLGHATHARSLDLLATRAIESVLEAYTPGSVAEIPACRFGCGLFRGKAKDAVCGTCGSPRKARLALRYCRISVWVQAMLANPELALLLHGYERGSSSDQIASFYDSEGYRNLKRLIDRNGTPYYTDFTITLALQMGAKRIAPRSPTLVWTASLANLNVPAALRHREEYMHVVFAVGADPVDLELYLEPLREELEELSEQGIWCWDASAGREVRVRVVLAAITGTFPRAKNDPYNASVPRLPRQDGWITSENYLREKLLDPPGEHLQANEVLEDPRFAPLRRLQSVSDGSFVPDVRHILHHRCTAALLNLLGGFGRFPLTPLQSTAMFGATAEEWLLVEQALAVADWPSPVLGPRLPENWMLGSTADVAAAASTLWVLLPAIMEHLSVGTEVKEMVLDFCVIARYLQAPALSVGTLNHLKEEAIPKFIHRLEGVTSRYTKMSPQGQVLTLKLLRVPFDMLDVLVDVYTELGPVTAYDSTGSDVSCRAVNGLQLRVVKDCLAITRTPLLSRYACLRNAGMLSPQWDFFLPSAPPPPEPFRMPFAFDHAPYHELIALALQAVYPPETSVNEFEVMAYRTGLVAWRQKAVELTAGISTVKFLREGEPSYGVVRAFVTVKLQDQHHQFCLVDQYPWETKSHALVGDSTAFRLFRSRPALSATASSECIEVTDIVRPMGEVTFGGASGPRVYVFEKQ